MTQRNHSLSLTKTVCLQFIVVAITFWLAASAANAQLLRFSSEWPDTDFENSVIDLAEVMSGGVPKDGIPAIDHPEFVSVDSASQWLDLQEPVIVSGYSGSGQSLSAAGPDLA